MAFTRTWNATYEAAPAGSTDVSAGDDRIRDFKLDIRERLNIDHYHDPAGTDADHGEHRKITFHEPISSPSNVANKAFLFGKDVGGKIELHYLDEDDNEIQLTKAGILNPLLLKDEDDLVSNSDQHGATQQSVKAYVDSNVVTFVNNANGNPNISDTIFDVDSNVAETNWESIGPTAGGQDNTWTALDSVPAGADWIEVKVIMEGTNGATDSQAEGLLHAREGGGAQGLGQDNIIGNVKDYVDGAGMGFGGGVSCVKIPVSSRAFEVYWSSTFTSTVIDLVLTGYGYNP